MYHVYKSLTNTDISKYRQFQSRLGPNNNQWLIGIPGEASETTISVQFDLTLELTVARQTQDDEI